MNALTRLAGRLVLEESLLDFTRYMFKARTGNTFILNSHHEVICHELQALVDGHSQANVGQPGSTEILIINMPPRYGKTELAIINFIPWCLARNPQARFIHLSYSDKLALDNSANARELMKHEAYQELWGLGTKPDVDAKGLWKTEQGGGMMATAAGGAITGFGAGVTGLGAFGKAFGGCILIDDPLKPDDAASETERSKVNDRLVNTIVSRRNSRETPIVLIMQRLHEDDMTGFVLRGLSGLRVRHVKLAAITPDGGALWEQKHSLADLQAMKAASPYNFAGQYQQEPAPEEGVYFLRDWFKPYDKLPEYLNYYGASDFAVSDKRGDYTVHGVFGVDPAGELYLVDWWRQQATSDIWVNTMLDLAHRYKTLAWALEGGVIQNAVMPLVRSEMRRRNQYPRLASYPSMTDKQARARNIQGRLAARGIWVPRQPWVADLLSECIHFPNSKHDDQVDTLSLFGNMLANLQPGIIPPVEREGVNTEMPTIEQLIQNRLKALDRD